MNRTRYGREAAAALLARKAIPLEERLFLPIVLAAVAVFALVFLPALGLDAGLERRRNDALAAAFVERWFFGGPGLPSRAVPERPLDALEPYVLVPVDTLGVGPGNGSSAGFGDSDHAFLETPTGDRYVLVRHKGIFGADRALAVPRHDLPTVTDPDTSGRARLGVALAIGLGLYLVVVRYLLRRMVFGKLSALARVIYARRIFSLTGGIPFDSRGNPVDGLWHVRSWLGERLSRLRAWVLREGARPASADGSADRLPARIERVAEPPHVPLETFGNDELGQIALALEEGILRLAKHESQVLGAYDAVGFPVWVFTRDGVVVHANRAALPISRRALGATVDAKGRARLPEGATLTSLFVGALGFDGHLLSQCLAACELRRPKFTCAAGRGERVLVSVSALPLAGKPLGVLMVVPAEGSHPTSLETAAPDDGPADPDLSAA